MRTTLALVSAVLAAQVTTQPAGAAEPPAGYRCRYVAARPGGSGWHATVYGGPVVAPGAAAVTLTCRLHVYSWWNGGETVVLTATSPTTPAAAVVVPEPTTFPGDHDDLLWVCSEATGDGTTWYHDGVTWRASPVAWCSGDLVHNVLPDPLSGEWPPDWPDEVDPLLDWVGCVLTWGMVECWHRFDPMVCALWAGAPDVPGVFEVRDDGDVYVAGEWVWDCWPYGS